MVVLGGGGVSYERGTFVVLKDRYRARYPCIPQTPNPQPETLQGLNPVFAYVNPKNGNKIFSMSSANAGPHSDAFKLQGQVIVIYDYLRDCCFL